MKRWNIQHVASVGQRKNLSPRRESNPRPSVHRSDARDMLNIPSFHISSPSLKFTIFLYLSPLGYFDIADPSSMQDACHYELSKYDLCPPRVSQ